MQVKRGSSGPLYIAESHHLSTSNPLHCVGFYTFSPFLDYIKLANE